MTWTDRRVLVTGAGGFLGSAVVEALAAQGAAVTCLLRDRAAPGALVHLPPRLRDGLAFAEADITRPEGLAALVEGHEAVLHLAALVGVPYSFLRPVEVARTTALGTVAVLEACRRAGVARVVCLSTAEVYGRPQASPINETHPLGSTSPYGASKIAADQFAAAWHRGFGLPVAVLRAFNTFGPRQSARAVVPTIITQALKGGAVRLGAVSPTRDMCFVADTAAAILLAAAVPEAAGRVFNIGTGRSVSIGGIAERIFALLGRAPEIVTEEKRLRGEPEGGPPVVADASLARRVLGWEPRLSLDEGLARTIDWIRAHPGFFTSDEYQV
ncbi:MAG: GDP-mannose 4,6-dehydratase [Roseomonas sp.]|nr:GDP-mannose 4,6-dehydratase [Roseomonas sp.]